MTDPLAPTHRQLHGSGAWAFPFYRDVFGARGVPAHDRAPALVEAAEGAIELFLAGVRDLVVEGRRVLLVTPDKLSAAGLMRELGQLDELVRRRHTITPAGGGPGIAIAYGRWSIEHFAAAHGLVVDDLVLVDPTSNNPAIRAQLIPCTLTSPDPSVRGRHLERITA